MKIERRLFKVPVLICFILSSITLFFYSNRFVSAEITSKWMALMIFTSALSCLFYLHKRIVFHFTNPLLLLFIVYFLFVFCRSWIYSSLNTTLLMSLSVLLLLFLLIQHIQSVIPVRYIFATMIFFALILTLHGLLQYTGMIRSYHSHFPLTGHFDNPAGFAAALIVVLPFCFHFVNHTKKYIRFAAIAALSLMAIAVFLSGSRAGILAVAVASVIWSYTKIKNNKTRIILAIVLVILPVVLYAVKKDSADGRLLIWRCSLDMAKEKPVFGHGAGAFNAKYMLYQAEYFKTYPDSRFAQLADNVTHPFNEYFLLFCEHGLVGLGMVALLIIFLFRFYRRNPSNEKLVALMSLSSLAVFSFFSYPFRYPFTWMILFINLATVIASSDIIGNTVILTKGQHLLSRHTPRIGLFLLSTGILTYSLFLTRAEIKWKQIARFSFVKVLSEYDKLYRWLGSDGLFLYNHAAELYEAKEFENSLAVFELCTRYHNDMDVQMFLAANYKALGRLIEAERHY